MYINFTTLIHSGNVIRRYECDRVLHRLNLQGMQKKVLMTVEKSSISGKASLFKTQLLIFLFLITLYEACLQLFGL